jgi:hypothetical protein
MGIFRDLISNVANARMMEEQQKLQRNLNLGQVLTTLIQNPYTDPATLTRASSLYKGLLRQHGGKQGRDIQDQIDQLLGGLIGHRTQQWAQQDQGGGQQGGQQAPPVQPTPPGGTQAQQGEPTVADTGPPVMRRGVPSGMPPQQPVPPGQTAGQPGGVNYGWQAAGAPATPVTLAGGAAPPGPQQQPAAAQRSGGFRSVLRALAGAGGEMLGIPRGGADDLLMYDPKLFGPTPGQAAQEAGTLAGVQRGAETTASIKATMAAFADPKFRQQMKDQGLTDAQIGDAELRALGVPSAQLTRTPMVVFDPEGTRHNWWVDRGGQYYDEMGAPVNLGAGWSQYKIGTEKAGGSDQMATQLRPGYQASKILLTRQHRKDGTWEQGWDQKRVDDESLVQSAIQYERASGSTVVGREEKNARDNALGKLSGVTPPPEWMSEGASFDAQVGAAMGRTPPSAYEQPVPAKGQPITDPAAAAAFDEFALRASKVLPMGRQDEWAQVRYNYGLKIAMAQMGTTNPFELSSVFELKKDQAKALSMTVQRAAGVETLNQQLHAFGDLLQEARSRVDNTGIPLIDRYVQRGTRGLGDLTGDQANFVGQLDVALNAVSRIYGQLISNNAYVSVAMPHVQTEAQAREALQGYMSDKTIGGVLDRMYTEADADRQKYKQREAEQFNELSLSLPEAAAQARGATPTPSPVPTRLTPTPTPGRQGTNGRGGTTTPPTRPMPKTGDEFWKNRGLQ